jgi:hypothetical protein
LFLKANKERIIMEIFAMKKKKEKKGELHCHYVLFRFYSIPPNSKVKLSSSNLPRLLLCLEGVCSSASALVVYYFEDHG